MKSLECTTRKERKKERDRGRQDKKKSRERRFMQSIFTSRYRDFSTCLIQVVRVFIFPHVEMWMHSCYTEEAVCRLLRPPPLFLLLLLLFLLKGSNPEFVQSGQRLILVSVSTRVYPFPCIYRSVYTEVAPVLMGCTVLPSSLLSSLPLCDVFSSICSPSLSPRVRIVRS